MGGSAAGILPWGRPGRGWWGAATPLSLRGGRRGGRRGRGRGGAALARHGRRFSLPPGQQRGYLVWTQQTWQTQVVLLLRGTGLDRNAERRTIEDHLVEFGRRRQRLELLGQLVTGLLRLLRPLQQLVVVPIRAF